MEKTLYLIIGCFFFSCHQQKQLTGLATSIKGEWQGTLKHVDDFENRNIFFCFEDSLCTISDYRFTDFKYYLDHDTVIIESIDTINNYFLYQYTILKRTGNSLILLSPATDRDPADTITFKKIHKKNTITPSAIYFASSACFGTCPEMYLEIDSARNVLFYGEQFTEKVSGFRGKIDKVEYETILNQINNLPVDSLKDYFSELGSDVQTRGVAIESAGKLIKSTAYGSYNEPVELTMLLNKLMNLYLHLPLQADTTVTRDYFSNRPTKDLIFYPMKRED